MVRVSPKGTQKQTEVKGSTGTVNFNLSKNKSLRTLETAVGSITCATDAVNFFKSLLSTTKMPLDVVVIYKEAQFGYQWNQQRGGPLRFSIEHFIIRQLRVLREACSGRNIQLIICVDVKEWIEERAVKIMERILEAEMGDQSSDYFKGEVSIICDKRTIRGDPDKELPKYFSAL